MYSKITIGILNFLRNHVYLVNIRFTNLYFKFIPMNLIKTTLKKLILIIGIMIFAIASIHAQDSVKKDTAWKAGGQFLLTFSQAALQNWAAGGENSYAGNTRLGLFAKYASGKTIWENNLDMAIGISKQESQEDIRKADDFIELNSKYGYKASEKWYYSVLFNTRTQFGEGRKYLSNNVDYTRVSDFMAPVNINFAVGMDYKPNKALSVFLSPVNSKFIYVKDTSLSVINSLEPGTNSRYELGFISKMKYEKSVLENMSLMTKLDLFADYLSFESIEDVDVNWELLVTFKVIKILAVNLNVQMVWDNDILPAKSDGTLGSEAKLQVKQIFGAGLTYKF